MIFEGVRNYLYMIDCECGSFGASMCAHVYVFVFKYSAVNLTHLVSIRYYISVSFFSTQAYNIRYINNSHCIF